MYQIYRADVVEPRRLCRYTEQKHLPYLAQPSHLWLPIVRDLESSIRTFRYRPILYSAIHIILRLRLEHLGIDAAAALRKLIVSSVFFDRILCKYGYLIAELTA